MSDAAVREYAYFPGCSALATSRDYEASTQGVARVLGLKLVELDDWNCCGTTLVNAMDKKQALVLAARNLALAEKTGRDLVTGCSGCYLSFLKSSKLLAENAGLREEIQNALAAGGMDYEGPVRIRHLLEILAEDSDEESVRRQVKRPLTGLKVACYYGCQIGRPFAEADDEEDPQLMDKLVGWLGAEAVPFPLKAKCCGGMLMTAQPQIGQELTGKVLKNAKAGGADCVITACPLCQINLEAYQGKAGEAVDADCKIPVLYFTQLMGTAFGLSPKELALSACFTPVRAMLAKKVQSA